MNNNKHIIDRLEVGDVIAFRSKVNITDFGTYKNFISYPVRHFGGLRYNHVDVVSLPIQFAYINYPFTDLCQMGF